MCAANGGIYQGDGTPCTPNPCGAAIGACCFGDGLCQLTDPFDCVGVYMGDWTTCTPESLRQPDRGLLRRRRDLRHPDPGQLRRRLPGRRYHLQSESVRRDCRCLLPQQRRSVRSRSRSTAATSTWGTARCAIPTRAATSRRRVRRAADRARCFLGTPYPTPTTGEVEIAWSLPQAGFASLTVWDAEGRQRATLFQGDVNAGPGGAASRSRTRPAAFSPRASTG